MNDAHLFILATNLFILGQNAGKPLVRTPTDCNINRLTLQIKISIKLFTL